VVTSYPAAVWQPNCVETESIQIVLGVLLLFSQRLLVALDTDQGVIYAPATGWDRVFLLWTFRNFRSLPQNVLSRRQQQFMGSLYRAASNYRSDELHDAVLVGTVEGFTLSALPTSFKVTKPVAAERKAPDVPTLASKLLYTRVALNRMTLKVSTAAVVLVIAILAWHQLGAQPIVNATSAEALATAHQPLELNASASEVTPKDLPQKDSSSASALASNPIGTASLASTNFNPETTTAYAGTAAPAIQPSAAPPDRSVRQPPAHTLAAVRKPNDIKASLDHPVSAPANTSETAVAEPRMQISGRPRKLVYPVCPETQARGKVSLQAVVGYDGAVSRVRVLTGDRTLAAAAVEAVRQWRYEPFSGASPQAERETSITISFISNEVVAVSFPSSAPLSR
jgi:outer membrane biosynthesis protein TonB